MSYFVDKAIDKNYYFAKKTLFILGFIIIVLSIIFNLFEKNDSIGLMTKAKKMKPFWEKSFFDNGFSSIDSITKTKNGYLIIGAKALSNTVQIIETSELGEILWEKSFVKHGSINGLVAIEIENAYVASDSARPKENGATYIIDKPHHRVIAKIPYCFNSLVVCEDGFIATDEDNNIYRFDGNGDELWHKKIDIKRTITHYRRSSQNNEVQKVQVPGIAFSKVIGTKDGNYIAIAGRSFFIMKFDRYGEIIWKHDFTKRYQGWFHDIIEMPDGSFLADVKLKGELHLFKLDSKGNILYNKKIADSKQRPFSSSFNQFKDNQYLLSASFVSRDFVHLFIVDANGEIQNHKNISLAQKDFLVRDGMIRTGVTMQDGSILLGGHVIYKRETSFIANGKRYETLEIKDTGVLYNIE